MKLVIFDIDGTLTRTNEADEACFAASVRDHFKIDAVSTNWSDYEHSTDSGILDELVRRHHGKSPSFQDLEKFREVFISHLENHYRTKEGSFQAVAGASDLFKNLKTTAQNWTFAIATGGWKRSALLKLSKAKLSVDQVPAAFADDAFSRDDIIRQAIALAEKQSQTPASFEKIVYVGDGRWDFVSCQRLKIPFIGITDNRNPANLKSAGVKTLIQNYSDFPQFLESLEKVAI